MARTIHMTHRARRLLYISTTAVTLTLLVAGCGPRGLSCESYNKVYQEQLDKWAFYDALVEGIKGAGATRNNSEYDSALRSRDQLWESAEKVATSAANDGCFVERPGYE